MSSYGPGATGTGRTYLSASPAGGWWAATLLCVGLVGSVGCGAESAGASGAPGAAGGGDAAVRDAGSECGTLETHASCRERSACSWLTVTCDTGRVVGGCFSATTGSEVELSCDGAGDAGPSRRTDGCDRWGASGCDGSADTGASDAALDAAAGGSTDAASTDLYSDASIHCRSYTSTTACKSDAKCTWWTGTCDGNVVREECLAKGESPPSVDCKSVAPEDCHDAEEKSSCAAPNCEWVDEGCGSASGDTLEITDCLPAQSCSEDADCPTDHACAELLVDPCSDSACTACGRTVDRCVPDTYLSP